MKTVGEESRLKILCTLFEHKKICVSDIASSLGMSVAIVSHHLQVLEKKGVLTHTRKGKTVCYDLSNEPIVKDLKKFICKYKQP